MKGQIIMRSFLSIGAITFVGAAALFSCGDDSSDPNPTNGGSGGAAGSAGGTAQGGTAGTGGGTSGTGGGANGGTGGGSQIPEAIATCTGCAELIVSVTGANSTANLADQAIFQFNIPAPGADFSNGSVTWRVMALENNANFFVRPFAQNGAARDYAGIFPQDAEHYRPLSAAEFPPNTWVDVTLDVSAYAPIAGGDDGGVDAAAPAVDAGGADAGDGGALLDPGNFDKATVEAFGLQLGTTGTFTGSGVIRVAVDSVTVAGVPGQADRTFTTGLDGLILNTYEQPPNTPAPVFHQ